MSDQKTQISQWVDSYTQDMVNWAIHRTSNADIARDLVQETFLAALEGISKFKGDSNPKTWLFSILKNKIVDYYRKKGREKVSETITFGDYFDENGNWHTKEHPFHWEEEESNLLDNAEFNSLLEMCLQALPEKWRTGLILKYHSSKKSEEICQELEVTPTNYWQIVHRAKLQLRDCIENNWK